MIIQTVFLSRPQRPALKRRPYLPTLLGLAALIAGSATPATAATVIASQDFEDTSVPTSTLGFWALAGTDCTVAINTDTAQNYLHSNGSLKGSYINIATGGGNYIYGGYDVSALNTRELYIEFWAKMPNLKRGLKFLKIFGQHAGGDPNNYANTTFGLDYTGVDYGCMYATSFGDGSTTSNDTQAVVLFDGTNPSWIGRSYGTAVVSTPQHQRWASSNWGTAWHHFRFHIKFNSGTSAADEVADGIYYVEIDGAVYVDATGLFNRHYSNAPIQSVSLFGWTQKLADNFDIWYDNVQVTTGGFVGSPPPPNHAPVASDQNVDATSGTATPITLAATDADLDTLSYTIVSGPSHGSLSGSANGASQTYTPNPGYTGSDSFTFKASDGIADSNVATVTIAVDPAPSSGGGGGHGGSSSGGGCGVGGTAGLLIGMGLLLRLRRRR